MPDRSWGRLYKRPGTLTPTNYAGLEENPPRVAEWMPGEDPPPEAAELLRVAGVADQTAT